MAVDPRAVPPPPPPPPTNGISSNNVTTNGNGVSVDESESYKLRFCTVCASNQNR